MARIEVPRVVDAGLVDEWGKSVNVALEKWAGELELELRREIESTKTLILKRLAFLERDVLLPLANGDAPTEATVHDLELGPMLADEIARRVAGADVTTEGLSLEPGILEPFPAASPIRRIFVDLPAAAAGAALVRLGPEGSPTTWAEVREEISSALQALATGEIRALEIVPSSEAYR